jgi:hypothetical protein
MTTLPNKQCYTLNNDKATFTLSNTNFCSLFAIIFSSYTYRIWWKSLQSL